MPFERALKKIFATDTFKLEVVLDPMPKTLDEYLEVEALALALLADLRKVRARVYPVS